MDCENCPDATRVMRGCPLPLRSPKSEAFKRDGWAPIEEGPKACARLVADRDPDLHRWISDYHRLEAHHTFPHSPGDWGAQGAKWSAAIDLIRVTYAELDREEIADAKKEAEMKKGNKGGKRRR